MMSLAEEHNWNLTAPDLFNQTLRAWITDQPLPPELRPLRPTDAMARHEAMPQES